MPTTRKRAYRIVSFDGGGVRGVLSLVLLRRLESALPGWLNRVDLLAGTSTGGIIALALARGLAVEEVLEFYRTKSAAIFHDTTWDNIHDLGALVGARYDTEPLAGALREVFGESRLGDLKKRVLIPAFDLDNEQPGARRTWAPKFFHNYPGRGSDRDQPCWKVALYTSAAPTYFPSVDGYIDGGVAANNPSVAALAQTQDRRHMRTPPPLARIALLSVGTGQPLLRIEGEANDWGQAQWARPILSILTDGVLGVADYECARFLGARYHRLAPVLPPDRMIPMDAFRRIPEIEAFAESVDLSDATRWLRGVWSAD